MLEEILKTFKIRYKISINIMYRIGNPSSRNYDMFMVQKA